MFVISMPLTFSMGDRATVRINQHWATLWWRDAKTLVVNTDDVRVIWNHWLTGDDHCFVCADDAQAADEPFA